MKAEHNPSEERLKELLVGKKVVAVSQSDNGPKDEYSAGPTGLLTLSDDTTLELWGNDGGCACNSGCYPLTELNTCDNAITNVQVESHPDGDDYDLDREGYYRIFVYAENRQITLASFDGTDGNGYYGTGWWLRVRDGAS